jgi:hypothetical protein
MRLTGGRCGEDLDTMTDASSGARLRIGCRPIAAGLIQDNSPRW